MAQIRAPLPGPSSGDHGDQKRTIRIGIFAFNGSNAIDFMGPIDVFNEANRSQATSVRYQVDLIGAELGPIVMSSGVQVLPDKILSPELDAVYDTILITGPPEFHASAGHRLLITWLKQRGPTARRICAICTGTFILASAGCLDGRRVAIHRGHTEQFSMMFPRVRIEPDRLFVHDGSYYTAAGGTAGIDLCLHLIENDCGKPVFLDVARMLVIFLRRSGHQSQVSEFLRAQSIRNTQICRVIDWAVENLTADLSVDALARRAAMSPRNFSRAFADELTTTPARFVEQMRVEAARILLETTPLSIQQIAHRIGFRKPANMRRAFIRAFQAPPLEYRQNFNHPTPNYDGI